MEIIGKLMYTGICLAVGAGLHYRLSDTELADFFWLAPKTNGSGFILSTHSAFTLCIDARSIN